MKAKLSEVYEAQRFCFECPNCEHYNDHLQTEPKDGDTARGVFSQPSVGQYSHLLKNEGEHLKGKGLGSLLPDVQNCHSIIETHFGIKTTQVENLLSDHRERLTKMKTDKLC